jgi:hypothetical protein|tara:strand:+ start:1369 stop:3222 length:1854 start_codon:yes stop_codon:yes gene_type:complete
VADFKTPNLAGSSAELNSVLNKFDSIKSEVSAGLELDASALTSTLNTSIVDDLTSKLKSLVPEIPALPNVNLQSEMSSLLSISQDTVAGQLEFAAKQADLKSKFGDGLTAGGFDLDTLTTNAAAAQTAALTATTDISSATSALSTAKETATSSLDTALDASLKLDRSNIPNPTGLLNNLSESSTSAISALSSEASATTALANVKGAATRIQDVIPNFELPAAGGDAFQKAAAVLQAEVDTEKEEISLVLNNPKLEEDIKAKAAELKQFKRDAPKVLPTEDSGAFAVTTKAKEITITTVPEEASASSTEEKIDNGGTIKTTQTTAKDSIKEVASTGGEKTILRANVAPHGFSRRPTSTVEEVSATSTKESPSTIKKETRTWTDSNGDSGTVEIDVITLANKPVQVQNVYGYPAEQRFSKKGKKKSQVKKPIYRAGGEQSVVRGARAKRDSSYKDNRDRFSMDENGKILIGWADKNGNPPLPDGTFADGIWYRRYFYSNEFRRINVNTKKKPEGIYKVNYKYNENYDPSFDGDEGVVKDKGNPKEVSSPTPGLETEKPLVIDGVVMDGTMQYSYQAAAEPTAEELAADAEFDAYGDTDELDDFGGTYDETNSDINSDDW